ncbi:hypothetical protein OTK49_21520 [Vibrio coralliirubri]|uniref:hypothetical protein n=1 Tax=Vibrio coralliirubri TaxID=1516159 RepID=UPI002284AD3D|nr:hypothetical protein [Vibrio coralliirubri]MCY9865102.1 hypothetical protein [Vibrio coralliirubri]
MANKIPTIAPPINKKPITAGSLFPRLGQAMKPLGKSDGTTTQITEEDYKEMRKQLNDAFEVGICPPYTGSYRCYVELGELQFEFKDTIGRLTRVRLHPDHPIQYETRVNWRNTLIQDLDYHASL